MALQQFKADAIDMEEARRKFLNFFLLEEKEMQASTYGEEIYIEFLLPEDELRDEGKTQAITANPSFLKNAKRIVISSSLKDKLPKIKEKLRAKELDHIEVEVKE